MNKKIFIVLLILTANSTQPMAINPPLALAQHQQSNTKIALWATRLIGLTFGIAGVSDFITARKQLNTTPILFDDDRISGFIFTKPIVEIMSGLILLCMGQCYSNAQARTDILVYHLEQQAIKEVADKPEQPSAPVSTPKLNTADTIRRYLPSAGIALLRRFIPIL